MRLFSKAVRTRAGLFDVTHMGTLEVAGPDAERFLDLMTVNYVAMLRIGQAHYSYLLDPDGRVIDDILVYRRGEETFFVVVNAANAEEDEAWLRAAASGKFLLDVKDPGLEPPKRLRIRNLKDPSSGDDRRVDLALQGPAALPTLLGLAGVAAAQSTGTWPDRPIRYVVAGPAGGGMDVFTRMIADKVQSSLKQPVVVENKPGAGGALGFTAIAQAKDAVKMAEAMRKAPPPPPPPPPAQSRAPQ